MRNIFVHLENGYVIIEFMDASHKNGSGFVAKDNHADGGDSRRVEVFFGDANKSGATVNVGNTSKGEAARASDSSGIGVVANVGMTASGRRVVAGESSDTGNSSNIRVVNGSSSGFLDINNASKANSSNDAIVPNNTNNTIDAGFVDGRINVSAGGLDSSKKNDNSINNGGIEPGSSTHNNVGGVNSNFDKQGTTIASTFALNTDTSASPLVAHKELSGNSAAGNQFNSEVSDKNFSAFDNKFNQSVNDSVSEIFHKNNVPVNSGSGDIVLGRGRKRKTGLIAGIIIAAVGVVVGVILFITLGLPAMDPKTGSGIKARNYEEAFNIFANYFLFGEESKEAVDWEATTGEDFVSYFQRITETPFDVEGVVTGQKTVGGEIKKMKDDYSVFRKMYLNLKEKSDTMVQFVNDYEQLIEFANEYYSVGLPSEFSIADKYVEGGYDAAQDFVNQVATAYESVGALYDYDVSALIGDYGYNKLSAIEIYNQLGCMDDDGVDYTCVSSKSDLGNTEYLLKAADEYSSIFSIKYNVENSIESAMFNIMSGLNLIQNSNTNEERKF